MNNDRFTNLHLILVTSVSNCFIWSIFRLRQFCAATWLNNIQVTFNLDSRNPHVFVYIVYCVLCTAILMERLQTPSFVSILLPKLNTFQVYLPFLFCKQIYGRVHGESSLLMHILNLALRANREGWAYQYFSFYLSK